MIPMHPNQIGGARVQRGFQLGGRRVLAGDTLTGDEVRGIRQSNRTALVESGYLLLWPKDAGAGPAQPPQGSVRFIAPRGFGKYDVIEGRKLNDEPLTKEQAHELAGVPLAVDKSN